MGIFLKESMSDSGEDLENGKNQDPWERVMKEELRRVESQYLYNFLL